MDHYQQLHFSYNQTEYLITRVFCRIVLSSYLKQTDPVKLAIECDDNGKRRVTTNNLSLPLHFNISHSGKMIVMAIACDVVIGVDVENTSREYHSKSIIDNSFSKNEIEHLNKLNPMYRNNSFFEIWTLKESYIKARGLGHALELDKFGFYFTDNANINI